MIDGDRLPQLDAWDAVTRDARAPSRLRVGRPRTSMPVGMLVVGAVGLAIIAALQLRPIESPGTGVAASPSPSELPPSFAAPTDSQAPLERRLLQFDDVTLSADGVSVQVDFTGAAPGGTFDPSQPCSVGYEATAAVVDGELHIGLYVLRGTGRAPAPSRLIGCTQVGYARSLDLALATPFSGSVVRDLAGQIFWLEPPPWLGVVDALPDGWELREQGNVRGMTPRWERTWSPVEDPNSIEGDPLITLIQSHGGPISVEGGSEQVAVEVHGTSAILSIDPYPYGTELLLIWSIGDDEFALVGYAHDFSRRAFIDIAESVTIPDAGQP